MPLMTSLLHKGILCNGLFNGKSIIFVTFSPCIIMFSREGTSEDEGAWMTTL